MLFIILVFLIFVLINGERLYLSGNHGIDGNNTCIYSSDPCRTFLYVQIFFQAARGDEIVVLDVGKEEKIVNVWKNLTIIGNDQIGHHDNFPLPQVLFDSAPEFQLSDSYLNIQFRNIQFKNYEDSIISNEDEGADIGTLITLYDVSVYDCLSQWGGLFSAANFDATRLSVISSTYNRGPDVFDTSIVEEHAKSIIIRDSVFYNVSAIIGFDYSSVSSSEVVHIEIVNSNITQCMVLLDLDPVSYGVPVSITLFKVIYLVSADVVGYISRTLTFPERYSGVFTFVASSTQFLVEGGGETGSSHRQLTFLEYSFGHMHLGSTFTFNNSYVENYVIDFKQSTLEFYGCNFTIVDTVFKACTLNIDGVLAAFIDGMTFRDSLVSQVIPMVSPIPVSALAVHAKGVVVVQAARLINNRDVGGASDVLYGSVDESIAKAPAVFSINSPRFELSGLQFVNNTAAKMLELMFFDTLQSISLEDSLFQGNSGGSCVFVRPHNFHVLLIQPAQFQFSRINITNNTGVKGTGFSFFRIDSYKIGGIDVKMSQIQCLDNFASESGACMYIDMRVQLPDTLKMEIDFGVSAPKWAGNYAEIAGGSFYIFAPYDHALIQIDPDPHSEYAHFFYDSKAGGYGDIVALSPYRYEFLGIRRKDSNESETTVGFPDPSFVVYPGESIDILFRIYDSYEQLVIGQVSDDILEFNTISGDGQSGVLTRTSQITKSQRYAEFYDVQFISHNVSSNLTLRFSSPTLQQTDKLHRKVAYYIDIVFSFFDKGCPINYEMLPGEGKCVLCPSGYYKIVEGHSSCKKCPFGAVCSREFIYEGKSQIEAEENFWLLVDNATGFVESYYCIEEEVCVESSCSEESNRDPAYPLCQACLPGFYMDGEQGCVEYSSKEQHDFPFDVFLYIFVYVLLVVVFLVASHIYGNLITLNSTTKTLIFFSQSLSILRKGGVNMANSKSVLFTILKVFQDILTYIFDFGWLSLLQHTVKTPFYVSPLMNMFFQTLIRVATIIFLVILLASSVVCKFLVCRVCKRRRESVGETSDDGRSSSINSTSASSEDSPLLVDELPSSDGDEREEGTSGGFFMRRIFQRLHSFNVLSFSSIFKTSIFLFNVVFESLVDECLSFFTCPKFGNSRRVLFYTDVVCGSGAWRQWIPYYVIVLCLVLIIPLLVFGFLVVNRKRLEEHWFEVHFGLFYEEYKQRFFYFEVVLYFQRFAFVILAFICNTFLQRETSSLVLSFSFFFFFAVFLLASPFKKTSENVVRIIAQVILFGVSVNTLYIRIGAVQWTILLVSVVSIFTFSVIAVVDQSFLSKFLQKWIKKRKLDRGKRIPLIMDEPKEEEEEEEEGEQKQEEEKREESSSRASEELVKLRKENEELRDLNENSAKEKEVLVRRCYQQEETNRTLATEKEKMRSELLGIEEKLEAVNLLRAKEKSEAATLLGVKMEENEELSKALVERSSEIEQMKVNHGKEQKRMDEILRLKDEALLNLREEMKKFQ